MNRTMPGLQKIQRNSKILSRQKQGGFIEITIKEKRQSFEDRSKAELLINQLNKLSRRLPITKVH